MFENNRNNVDKRDMTNKMAFSTDWLTNIYKDFVYDQKRPQNNKLNIIIILDVKWNRISSHLLFLDQRTEIYTNM